MVRNANLKNRQKRKKMLNTTTTRLGGWGLGGVV